jgi:hypothetical protein
MPGVWAANSPEYLVRAKMEILMTCSCICVSRFFIKTASGCARRSAADGFLPDKNEETEEAAYQKEYEGVHKGKWQVC